MSGQRTVGIRGGGAILNGSYCGANIYRGKEGLRFVFMWHRMSLNRLMEMYVTV